MSRRRREVPRYSASAVREGTFWEIDVEGVGVTQATDVDDAYEMAKSLIKTVTHEEDAAVDIEFVW